MSIRQRNTIAAAIFVFIPTIHGDVDVALANEPPVADAGLPRYAAKDPVQLDGTGSYDPDGSASLSYVWTQISGPPVVLTGADTVTPAVSGFVPTDTIQECTFELLVSDGELVSRADAVHVIIVPLFGNNTLRLENLVFDANKPTAIYFGGGDGGIGYAGQYIENPDWISKANVIDFPYGYEPDSNGVTQRYFHYADMIITYLSHVAPKYSQPINISGWSLGGQPAIDVAVRLNLTYWDARYAVNTVTFLDAMPYGRDFYQQDIDLFLANPVDAEQCWIDNYVSTPLGSSVRNKYPGFKNNVLNIWFDRGSVATIPWSQRHLLAPIWYDESITSDDANRFNQGVVAGAYWSIVGPGKNLQLAWTPEEQVYRFTWYGDAYSGHMALYDESLYPGKLPEPVTLTGPEVDATIGADGVVLSCQPSENAVGYQILVGTVPDHMVYLLSDTPSPPSARIVSFPFERVYWTVRARDRYGSTIYADARPLHADCVAAQSIRNADTGQMYASIQQAINDAQNGDEIILDAGIWKYLENLDFKGKSITLRSNDANEPSIVAATILVGDARSPVVTLSSAGDETPTLDGLTLMGGTVGISCRDGTPLIRNCTIRSSGSVAVEFWEGYEPIIMDCNVVGTVMQIDNPQSVVY